MRVNSQVINDENSGILNRLERFSSWQKAKTAVALCMMYIKTLKDRTNSNRSSQGDEACKDKIIVNTKTKVTVDLCVKDLENAESEIIYSR